MGMPQRLKSLGILFYTVNVEVPCGVGTLFLSCDLYVQYNSSVLEQ